MITAGAAVVGRPLFQPKGGAVGPFGGLGADPLYMVLGVGQVTGSLANLPATAARTTYVVSDRVTTITDAAVPSLTIAQATLSSANQTGYIRLAAVTGRYEFRPQFEGGGGSGGVYASSFNRSTTPGYRNVVAVAMSEGLTSFDLEINGVGTSRSGMTVGQGWTTPGISAAVASNAGITYEVPVATYQFAGYHDADTRAKVQRALINFWGGSYPL